MGSTGHVVLKGTVSRLRVARTFIDGQLLDELSVAGPIGDQQTLRNIFCTNRLLGHLGAPGPKEIYVWNSHVFAVGSPQGLTDDIEGVRNSYLYRDRYLLLFLAASVVMLPYAIFVLAKKLKALASLPRVRDGHVDART